MLSQASSAGPLQRRPVRIRAWRAATSDRASVSSVTRQPRPDAYVEAVLASTEPHKRRQRLNLMLMRERRRGQTGAAGYDLARHGALKRALDRLSEQA